VFESHSREGIAPAYRHSMNQADRTVSGDSATGWVPAACTLPSAEQPLRVAEFGDLFASALHRVNRLSDRRLRLTLDAAAEPVVRDLVARESSCCSFFTFSIRRSKGCVELEVEVPVAQVSILDGLHHEATRRP
jgi:hypothetical protein